MRARWVALGIGLMLMLPGVAWGQNPVSALRAGNALRGVAPLSRALNDAMRGGYVLNATSSPGAVPLTVRELAASNPDVRKLLDRIADSHMDDGVLEAITAAGFTTNQFVILAVQYQRDVRLVQSLTAGLGGTARERLCGTGTTPQLARLTDALGRAQVFGGYESSGRATRDVIAVGTGQPTFESLTVTQVSEDAKTLKVKIPGRQDELTLRFNGETGIYNGFGQDGRRLTEVSMVVGEEGLGNTIVLRTQAENGAVTYFRGRLNRYFTDGTFPETSTIKEGGHVFGGLKTTPIGTEPTRETLYVTAIEGGYEVRLGNATADPVRVVYDKTTGNFTGSAQVEKSHVSITIPHGEEGLVPSVLIEWRTQSTDAAPLATFDGRFNMRATLDLAMPR